ncbi:OmpA family protein [Thioalkalivibrio nitratireducens]|nr:OmpA family protein [Thioalkalivibrio nitratireducens]
MPESQASRRAGVDWFYNINLPIADGTDVLVCQFRVRFDRNRNVAETSWRRFACERIFDELGVPPRIPEFEVLTLGADVLFEFDSDHITPDGRRELDRVAEHLRNEYTDPMITLVGHTDRIGDPAYNQGLSERRANAVRTYLATRGLPRRSMVAEGRGHREPLVFCEGFQVTQQLKNCLQPNRRVEVQVVERAAPREVPE